MAKNKIAKVGTIKVGDIKIRKKNPPPAQVQKTLKAYDRKRAKEEILKEGDDE